MGKVENRKGLGFNISMLYIMNIAKLIFPLITLPYLTRVLSVDSYGVVSYVKACMTYAQLIVDFGFMFSGVKGITEARNDIEKLGRVTGNVVMAKAFLCVISFAVIYLASNFIPILKENILFTLLSFVPVALTTLLLDFLFRGIEQMHIITIRYIVMKTISVVFTLVLVKSDADIMWIPILDIISSVVAIILVLIETEKLGIKISFVEGIKGSWKELKLSSVYFISEAATTVFGALNTLLVGIFLNKADVAYWAICLQLVAAVKALYTPVTNGIYPKMIQTRDISIIKKSLGLFMPLIVIGCAITIAGTELILTIVGSAKYVAAAPTMRCLVPVLFFCFPAMLLGWPTLGAINKVVETTKTTLSAATVQLIGLAILMLSGKFTLIGVAIMKSITELSLMCFRLRYCLKYKNEFTDSTLDKEKEISPMKNLLIKCINKINTKTGRFDDKTRKLVMYICIIGIMLNCYYYQIDDYLGHVCPAMLNAAIGTFLFVILLIIGIDRNVIDISIKKFPVAMVMICGFVVVLSGLNHYIGYSYIAMGLFMAILAPLYIIVWGEQDKLEKLFKCVAVVSTVLFALYCIVHIIVPPKYTGAYILEGRYMGMSFNPNGIAKTAVVGAISSIYCILLSKKKTVKILCSVVAGLGFSMLWITQSRANFIALIVALVFLLVIIFRNAVLKEKEKLIGSFLAVAIIIAMVPAGIYLFNNNAKRTDANNSSTIEVNDESTDEQRIVANIQQKKDGNLSEQHDNVINRMFEQSTLIYFSSGRTGMWLTAIEDASIIGHDMKKFKYVEHTYDDGTVITVEHAHNTCIELLNRSGIFAGLSFLLLEIYCAGWILVTVFSKKKKSDTEIFAVLGITIFGIASLFDIVVLPFAKMTVFIFYICLAEMCSKRNSTMS